MASCYSPLEQCITRFDLSFELMLNELCLLLPQTQNCSLLIKEDIMKHLNTLKGMLNNV